jgi:hypothetical protein
MKLNLLRDRSTSDRIKASVSDIKGVSGTIRKIRTGIATIYDGEFLVYSKSNSEYRVRLLWTLTGAFCGDCI